ncbi:hypothetical protein I3843_13G102200 [Carya illinoinensis]|nr:hypothetical protein I3760_13G115700 [Carya illinoinensis]KAG7950236.1 hypothetical protein I3843_13G102200 [Carya illinoinensis]
MTTYEQDPDVLQWGLQLFDSDPYSSCGYYGSIMQGDVDHYHGHYFEGDNYDTECSNIENDELIAQALQEELSQLAVVEAPGSSDEELERLQLSVVSQDWLGQSLNNSGSGISKFNHLKLII